MGFNSGFKGLRHYLIFVYHIYVFTQYTSTSYKDQTLVHMPFCSNSPCFSLIPSHCTFYGNSDMPFKLFYTEYLLLLPGTELPSWKFWPSQQPLSTSLDPGHRLSSCSSSFGRCPVWCYPPICTWVFSQYSTLSNCKIIYQSNHPVWDTGYNECSNLPAVYFLLAVRNAFPCCLANAGWSSAPDLDPQLSGLEQEECL